MESKPKLQMLHSLLQEKIKLVNMIVNIELYILKHIKIANLCAKTAVEEA